jgi:hypothetical protein
VLQSPERTRALAGGSRRMHDTPPYSGGSSPAAVSRVVFQLCPSCTGSPHPPLSLPAKASNLRRRVANRPAARAYNGFPGGAGGKLGVEQGVGSCYSFLNGHALAGGSRRRQVGRATAPRGGTPPPPPPPASSSDRVIFTLPGKIGSINKPQCTSTCEPPPSDAWRHLQMWPSLVALPRLYPHSATDRCQTLTARRARRLSPYLACSPPSPSTSSGQALLTRVVRASPHWQLGPPTLAER